ncbi:MAG: PilN domain-containing protein [Candidatus Muiribacteriota bacterium]
MKLKLDLLPSDRKSISRDFKSWVICAIIIVITFSWYIPVNNSNEKKLQKINSELQQSERNFNVKENEVNTTANLLDKPLQIEENIKFLIDFLGESSYSWYGFFQAIEESNPGKLWVDNIKKEKINEFVITGEAKNNYKISEFYEELMKQEIFSEVFLLQSEKTFKEEINLKLFNFRIRLKLKEEQV